MTLQQLEYMPSWEWPPEARTVLLATLRDEQAPESDRRVATELAGDLVVMDDEIAAVLVDVLQNAAESPDVRAAAAIALGPALEEADTLGDGDFVLDGTDFDDGPSISQAAVGRIQTALRRVYMDGSAPEQVRRNALEASVRGPQPWHRDAVAAALASGSASWTLTAVFCMRFVKGFEEQIVEALESEDDGIFYQAVSAAGEWGVEKAWPYVAALLESKSTDKELLLAAIEAVATIRPDEAPDVLDHLRGSDDEDIAAAVDEALVMAEGLSDYEVEEEDEP